MSARATLRDMFEPACLPAPPLDGLSTTWRYALAGFGYLGYLGTMIGVKAFEASVGGASPSGGASALPSAASTTVATTPDGAGVVTVDPVLSEMPTGLLVVDGLIGAAALWAIRYRRRWPFGLFMVLTTASVVSNSLWVVMVWSFISLCSRRDVKKIGWGIAYTIALSILASLFLPWQRRNFESFATLGPFGYAVPFLSTMLMMAIVALLGMYYGVRQDRAAGVQDRAANADRDRELAVLGERNRIAREMHDVLAHRISLVSMHAGALAYRTDLPPEKTREIAGIIQENAHASLTELRSVLSTLRDGQLDAAGSPAAPQPSLVDLPGLIGQARSLGQRVNLDASIDLATVPAVTARHVFRMIQECLTNARKHAPYAVTDVVLAGEPGVGLTIRVSNPLAPSGAGLPGAGLGLIGIRERAGMLGGQVNAGVYQGRFVVDGWVPWPAATG
ncbi:MAG TPA: histidine kinase [Propioniciclava tarda]|nr:histidine kinase [Propioniciclava tarda]